MTPVKNVGWHWKWLWLPAVCLLAFALLDCGDPVECGPQKACPSGQTCNEGKCTSTTPPADGGTDAPVTREAPPDQVTPKDETSTPEGPIAETPTGITVYRWRKANSGSQSDLYGASMPTETDGWVVGAGGTILYSKDAGKTWEKQTSPTTKTLRTVSFVDAKVGWAAGEGGVIIKTTDGGKTWEAGTTPTTSTIHTMQFLNSSAGFAAGDDFTFLVTRDGGATWQPSAQGTSFDLHGMLFRDRSNGYVVGTSGLIFYTRDSGNNVTTVVTGTQNVFWSIAFPDDTNGWAVGESGEVRKSDNRGESWEKVDTKVNKNFYDVHFTSLQAGLIVGQDGVMLQTVDGGKTWVNIADQSYPDLRRISYKSNKAGLIVGLKGTILWRKQETAECQPGTTDACYTGPAGTKDVGTCKAGTKTCEKGIWGPCVGQVLPEPKEVCFNDQDDNCNGKDDASDNCPTCKDGDKISCYTGPKDSQGVGTCRSGLKTCANGVYGKCEDEVLPAKEKCDGADNDCDGQVDEDIPMADRPPCALFYGICAAAKQECVGGKWAACKDSQYGADFEKNESKCDGKDNDCDSAIDEGCSCPTDGASRKCYNGPAGTIGVGVCTEGTQTCTNGKWTACQNQVKPSQEVCADGKDNDCDNQTDEVAQYSLFFNSQQSAHVSVPDSAALQPKTGLTVEGHFYIQNLNTSRRRTLISRAQSGGYSLLVDSPRRGQLSFRVWPNGGSNYTYLSISYSKILSANKWYHIAGTFDGTELRLYVNGKKVGTQQAATKEISYDAKAVPLLFGAEPDFGAIARTPDFFYGQIAQVRISGKAVYTADFTPDCDLSTTADTIGLWKMDSGTGDVIKDETGKHDGKREKTTWRETIRCKGFSSGGCKAASPSP